MSPHEADLYEALGIGPTASSDEIRSAYLRQVRQHPPEKDAEGFRRVQEAYEVLADEDSRKEYDETRRADPETRELIDQGRALIDEGNAEAIVPLKRALVRQPDSLMIRDLLVQAFLLAGSLEEAERQALTLTQRNPDNPAYWLRLGDVLRDADRDADAEGPYRRALELARGDLLPVLKLAPLLSYLERVEEAVELLRWAIHHDGRIDFEDFLFFQTLCRIYAYQGEIGELQAVHAEIRGILPPDPETRSFVAWFYYQDAFALAQLGNFDTALAMIEEAISIDDTLPEVREARRRIKETGGALREARELSENQNVTPSVRFSVGPLVLVRILGAEEQLKAAFEKAVEALQQDLATEGSGIGASVQLIRQTYPAVAGLTSDFLDQIESAARATAKTMVSIPCPRCSAKSLVNKSEWSTSWGTTFQCPKCNASFSRYPLLAKLRQFGCGGLILLGVLGSIISSLDDQSNKPRSRSPTPSTSSPGLSTPARTEGSLSSRIDSAKARARELEVEIQRMDSQLESFSTSIAQYKGEVEEYERQAELGIRVSQYAYEEALQHHNRLVDQYNALLLRRNLEYNEYEQLIDSVNAMVNRYNRGER